MMAFNKNLQAACHVLQGLYGYGQDRVRRLTNAGYDYNTVQNMVNRMMAGLDPIEGETEAVTVSQMKEALQKILPDAEELQEMAAEMAEELIDEIY